MILIKIFSDYAILSLLQAFLQTPYFLFKQVILMFMSAFYAETFSYNC